MLRNLISTCLLIAGVALPCGASGQTAAPRDLSAAEFLEDFDAAWAFVRESYAYFERKQTDWDRVRTLYRARVEEARGRREFVGVLEDMMEELYDPHAHLGVNTASSARLVPSGTDLWAEWQEGRAVLTEVRAGSEAERAGLRSGMEVLTIDGRPTREVVRERLPSSLRAPDPAADDWALRAALAGRRDRPVRLEVRAGGRRVRFEFHPGRPERPAAPISARILEGGLGYVRIHDALGDTALITAWDAAMAELRETPGLVLDLRDTPSGGNTTVARALLGRLVAEEGPYQRHELPGEERRFGVRRIWVEHVAPRGTFQYDRPVAVLVGRWTGSMGEGITIALDALRGSTTIGTPMAGLLGAVHETTLPNTGFAVRVPAERLYHVGGMPREAFVPTIPVQPLPGSDPGLAAAIELLRR
jgi:C-terminal processing protease CtpA/Prc